MSDTLLLKLPARELASGRPYAERAERASVWLDDFALSLWHGLLVPTWQRLGGGTRQAAAVVRLAGGAAAEFAALPDAALRSAAAALRSELRRSHFAVAPTARMFALLREAAGRVLGKRHYDCQLIAGWYLLHGNLVEMATGEGKTFAATLPACTAALVGLPVHVVTVNDYLASRDAEAMAPLYAFFGLRCAAIVHGLTREQRRTVYAGEIAYCSNKELSFDYLRDRSALGERASPLHRALSAVNGSGAAGTDPDAPALRGLAMAIVDEADSVFIDEARTPLILSAQSGPAEPGLAGWALALTGALQERRDFLVERALMRVRLTDDGRDRIEAAHDEVMASDAQPTLPSRREAVDAVIQALAAQWLYHRDRQYLVSDGKVQIVDESTGRVMADRAWERGLHQAIEAKEGLQASAGRVTIARITYQRFFRRYLRLSGMTGTGREVAAEIGRVYRLAVATAPLHRPSQARRRPPRCLRDADAKWQAVVQRVQQLALVEGRPVLVGTRTVWASEQLSQRLTQAGIAHVVLNAKQDRAEAEIIASAGQPGSVTVATNLAGRGTDIALGTGIVDRGGLQVLLTEFHESARVDRQLFGRAARQGDPGGGEAIVALDDELFLVHAPKLAAWLGRLWPGADLPAAALWLLRSAAQRVAEARHRRMRAASLEHDRRLAAMLAFSGRGE